MSENINLLVDSVIGQIQLATVIKQKAFIGVYVARQNLKSVVDLLVTKASVHFMLRVDNLAELEKALEDHYQIKINVWQKPDPYPSGNHLTLTVGNLTAIVFDYEESVYDC